MKKSIPHKVITGRIQVLEDLRLLIKKEKHGVLATSGDKGPYTSLIALAFSDDLKTLIFATPRDSQKYRNIKAQSNISILIDNRKNSSSDYMNAEAITIVGKAVPARRGSVKYDELSGILSGKHPQLRSFIRASSTALIKVDITSFVHVTGFQTVTHLDIA